MKHVSKKGFTLTEMMIVIAIIVIIAGAVAAGIAIDINRYNSFLDGQKAKYADGDDYMHDDSLWEAQARREVHNIYDSARESNEASRASNSAAAEASDAAVASNAAKASESAAALASASNAAASSAAASTSSAAASTSSAAAKTTQASSGGGGSGSALSGSSVRKSNTWEGGTKHEVQITLPQSSNSFVVYIPGDPYEINTYGNAQVVSLGNDQYRITYTYSVNSPGFQVYGVSESDIAQMHVVSQG